MPPCGCGFLRIYLLLHFRLLHKEFEGSGRGGERSKGGGSLPEVCTFDDDAPRRRQLDEIEDEDGEFDRYDNSAVGEHKVGSLNTGNRDVGIDGINQAMDTRKIISRLKPDLLSRLKSVAAGAEWKDKHA